MKITGNLIRNLMTSEISKYTPESKNTFTDKEFELRGNSNDILGTLEVKFNTNPHAKKIIEECQQLIINGSIRNYTSDKFFMTDSVNLLACLGLNAKGNKYEYCAIYDTSNLLSLALSIFFDTSLVEVENGLARYVTYTDTSYFNIVGALSSRYSSCSECIQLDAFRVINSSFDLFLEQCYVNYTNDSFMLGGVHLQNDEYTFNDIVKLSLEFFVTKLSESILNKTMQKYVEQPNKQAKRGIIVVQSKGLDNIILASDDKELFKPFRIRYGNFDIVLEPVICNSGNIGSEFIKHRISNFGLLTTTVN